MASSTEMCTAAGSAPGSTRNWDSDSCADDGGNGRSEAAGVAPPGWDEGSSSSGAADCDLPSAASIALGGTSEDLDGEGVPERSRAVTRAGDSPAASRDGDRICSATEAAVAASAPVAPASDWLVLSDAAAGSRGSVAPRIDAAAAAAAAAASPTLAGLLMARPRTEASIA